MNFTKGQQCAIYATNREVLVSAAAGSGKTAVLVERILHLIKDEGYSIERMLIVTYTRAAAAELRERLETRIQEAAIEEPALAREADKVSGAQISTIHSYCQKVVKEQFRFCQIDPQFSIGDERTMQSLYRDSMEETLDGFYTLAKEDARAAALAKKLPEKTLANVADALYHFLTSRPDPLGWFREQSEKTWSLSGLAADPAADAFVREAALILEGAKADWAVTKDMLSLPCFPSALERTIEADKATLEMLWEACKRGLPSLSQALNQCRFVTIARVKPNTSDEAALVDEYKRLRDGYKKTVQSVRELLPYDLEAAAEDMNAMVPALQGLYLFLSMLTEAYRQRKLDMAVLDFDDLEHMTFDVLNNDALRAKESQRFDAIFVDEYQDVSEIQEALLNGLKREPGQGKKQYVFYVGDVKQSIYRFRLAEPRLFLRKLTEFSPEEGAEQRKIILNKNFRSRVAVLDAVNRTFAHVMDARVTEIDYDRAAMLFPGGNSLGDPAPELHLISLENGKKKDAPQLEAELIARDILNTVGKPVPDGEGKPGALLRFRDVAILTPAIKGVGEQVEQALSKAGIPVYVDAALNALGGDEVMQTVQHVTLLDNPMNDAALIAELRSPLFEMTETELTAIRLEKPEREASYLDAVTHVAQNGKDATLRRRCAAVLAYLEEERFLYRNMPVQEYLWGFLSRSGLYAFYGAQPGGRLRQANLRMLCQKAEAYVQTHKEGLQGFLESVSDKTAGDGSSPTVVNPWEDVVRIMTIHKSKGLEFPTVYVMGMGTTLSRRRQTKTVSMHGELGLGLMYINEKARTKRTTVLQSAIQLRLQAEERAEKARLLYVAMTRAKSRLVMLGCTKGALRPHGSLWRGDGDEGAHGNSVSAVRSASCYLDWLWQVVRPTDICVETNFSTKPMWEKENEKEFSRVSTSFPHKNDVWGVFFHSDAIESMPSQTEKNVNGLFEKNILTHLEKAREEAESMPRSFSVLQADPLAPLPEYAHPPLKVGVTALCAALSEKEQIPQTDEAEETVAVKRMPLLSRRPRLMSSLAETPSFIRPEAENLPVARGSATHKLLEMISLEGVRQAAAAGTLASFIKEETLRLTSRGVLTPEEAALIDRFAVERFFLSQLGKRALASRAVKREWSFTLKINEPLVTLAQGVIDLCFIENGQWVLVDFKTDRVSSPEALWERYARQVELYRQALEKATAMPVKEAGLYALFLGQGSMKSMNA